MTFFTAMIRRSNSTRVGNLLTLTVIALLLLFVGRRHSNDGPKLAELSRWRPDIPSLVNGVPWRSKAPVEQWGRLPLLRDMWMDLAYMLEVSKPTNPPPHHVDRLPPNSVSSDQYTLEMSEDEIKAMRTGHKEFIRRSAAMSLEGTYTAGTKGIVTTAGGKYIPIFLVSLRILRRTGSTLPVEVFLANDDEYDDDLCTKLLPPLNAECRVLTHVLDAASNVKISSYQFKVFALLFSSFEDILFIDADNLVINDPTPLLSSEPYRSQGLVLWPDFWHPTVSPLLYEIQEKKERLKNEKTSETGQILISKRLHWHTLLLSTYYNLYGPKYYYSLLSLGAPGEGDKETFSTAADFLNLPYYQVKTGVGALGYFDIDNHGDFVGGSMLQFNPIIDANDHTADSQPEPSFIHANFPKFDPNTILHKGVTQWKDGKAHRMWHDIHEKGYRISWGADPERAVFEEMIVVACRDHGLFSIRKVPPACKQLRLHYVEVFGVLPGRVASFSTGKQA